MHTRRANQLHVANVLQKHRNETVARAEILGQITDATDAN